MARRVFLVMLLVASTGVAACGSGDDSPEPSNGAGTTDRPDLRSQIPEIPEIPSTSDGENGSGSSNGGSTRGSDGSPSGGSDASPGEPDRPSRRRSKGKPGSTGKPGSDGKPGSAGEPQFTGTQGAEYEQAKEICANVTLEGIAVNLRVASRDTEFVAKAFSRRYPAEHRRAVYEGCLEGFRHPVKPKEFPRG